MKTVERETSVIRAPHDGSEVGARYAIEEMTELRMLTIELD